MDTTKTSVFIWNIFEHDKHDKTPWTQCDNLTLLAAFATARSTQIQRRRHAVSSDVADDSHFFSGRAFSRSLVSGLWWG
jgi:hypothetical protein